MIEARQLTRRYGVNGRRYAQHSAPGLRVLLGWTVLALGGAAYRLTRSDA